MKSSKYNGGQDHRTNLLNLLFNPSVVHLDEVTASRVYFFLVGISVTFLGS